MTILQTIAVAFSMFSAIPMTQFEWSQKNMRYALCAFPLIGAVCGGLWCLIGVLPVPEFVRAAGFCLVPVLVTGGIHLDGFADTCDALSSYGDAEKKLEILKDPHCGAFAVIRLCTYFILYFALCASVEFTVRFGVIWILALTLERAFSGLAVASFPMAKNTGLAHTFATAADRTTVRRVLMVLAALLSAALLALGCHLCRSCQTGRCNWGIATQKPELVKRLNPDIGSERLVNLMTAWRHEIKELMGGMGINSIEALRGNRLMLRGIGLTEKELSILGVLHAGE